MKLEDWVRDQMGKGKLKACPSSFQGIAKDKIKRVLKGIDRETKDMVDVVFSLLDNQLLSWFSGTDAKFCDGASTAHIACHVGVYQRDEDKLDREGRDYWLKPLWEIGALEKVTFHEGKFIDGHPFPKSPNSGYRIASDFLLVLKLADDAIDAGLKAWNSKDSARARLARQAAAAEAAKAIYSSDHQELIKEISEHYVPYFLTGYEVVYIDDSDGDRVSATAKEMLKRAGLNLNLGDAMPDVLLWNPKTEKLWVVEAVCSDGEVDAHKFKSLSEFAKRSGKSGIGFTTAYPNWKTAADRQKKMKNLAPETYLWIKEDPSRQFLVSVT